MTASQNKRDVNVTPYGFTESGVAILSGALRSDKEINMNIVIMMVFVQVKKILLQ